MNLTITTTSTTLRRSLRHAALALCALVGLVAASCTADALDGADPNAGTNPDGTISFAVSPRPGFTEVPTTRGTDTKAVIPGNSAVIPALNQVQDDTRDLPNGKAGLSVQEIAGQARNDRESARNDRREGTATRAELADDATRWQQGDILWLIARFFHNKQDYAPDAVPDTIHVSALKYDGAAWRYLTVDEAADLHTANIPNFVRLLRWPPESAGWSDPGMKVVARYAGTGKPDTDGIITVTPQGGIPVIPAIKATNELSVPGGEPVSLQFSYDNSRIRIPAGYAAKFNRFLYLITFTPSNNTSNIGFCNSNLPAQQQDTDVFLSITGGSTVTLTRDGVSYSFAFPPLTDAEGNPLIDEDGNPVWNGASYTLTPYANGTQTPVAGYDLTVANETELRELARAVNAGEKLPNGKPAAEARVLQTADIELTKEWVPIGNSYANVFRGAYNGNGHTITGLTITTEPPVFIGEGPDIACAGLFSFVQEAVLTGIHLRNVQINIQMGSDLFELHAGSIAGALVNSTLSLCSASGTVNVENSGVTSTFVGGIAGATAGSTISRCQAAVETTAFTTHAEGSVWAGGIIGRQNDPAFILSCEVQGSAVTAKGNKSTYAGGIAGEIYGDCFTAFCRTGENVVTARGTGELNHAGGLAGSNDGFLYSCYSRATATATGGVNNYAGAIVGLLGSQGDVQYCYGTGATGKGTSDLNASPDNIIYTPNPTEGNIYALMSGYGDAVKFVTDGRTNWYLYTTSYNPGATPAHGIEPLRVQWTSAAWKDGTTTRYPEIDIEGYEGE